VQKTKSCPVIQWKFFFFWVLSSPLAACLSSLRNSFKIKHSTVEVVMSSSLFFSKSNASLVLKTHVNIYSTSTLLTNLGLNIFLQVRVSFIVLIYYQSFSTPHQFETGPLMLGLLGRVSLSWITILSFEQPNKWLLIPHFYPISV
jgi:hypothetical protein